jgi:hypothetical protein
MSNKLKAITTKAKALYKTGKYKKWTDAIKAASKTLPATKTATKTATKKKAKVGAVKKVAPKKKAATKKPTSIHKDSKSHNVRISVMSGTNQISTLNYLIKEKEKAENKLPALKLSLKTAGDKESKQHYSFWIKRYTKYISGLKKQISEAKKYI